MTFWGFFFFFFWLGVYDSIKWNLILFRGTSKKLIFFLVQTRKCPLFFFFGRQVEQVKRNVKTPQLKGMTSDSASSLGTAEGGGELPGPAPPCSEPRALLSSNLPD